MILHLIIRDIYQVICDTDIDDESPISDLKAVIADITQKSMEVLNIVYKGELLEDERTLVSYNIEDNSTLFVSVKKDLKSGQLDPSPQKKQTNGQSNGLFPGIFDSQLQGSLTKLIQDNPSFFADMMKSFPGFQEMVEKNPSIQHALNDPEMLKETLGLLSNNQTLAKSMDSMMNTIESIPGGISALSKQINQIPDPMNEVLNAFKPPPIPTKIDEKPPEKPSEAPLPFVPESPYGNNMFGMMPPYMPSQDPYPMYDMPSQADDPTLNSTSNPFSNLMSNPMLNQMFNQLPNDVSNQMMNSTPLSSPVVEQISPIPKDALTLITKGIEQCKKAGLDIADFPGCASLVKSCEEQASTNFFTMPFEELRKIYAPKLQQMNEMGFYDNEENLQALIESNGDLNLAVINMLSKMRENVMDSK